MSVKIDADGGNADDDGDIYGKGGVAGETIGCEL